MFIYKKIPRGASSRYATASATAATEINFQHNEKATLHHPLTYLISFRASDRSEAFTGANNFKAIHELRTKSGRNKL